jgi:hypothetical protein
MIDVRSREWFKNPVSSKNNMELQGEGNFNIIFKMNTSKQYGAHIFILAPTDKREGNFNIIKNGYFNTIAWNPVFSGITFNYVLLNEIKTK